MQFCAYDAQTEWRRVLAGRPRVSYVFAFNSTGLCGMHTSCSCVGDAPCADSWPWGISYGSILGWMNIHLPPFFPGILLSRKNPETQGNGRFLKRTMVENNGESTVRMMHFGAKLKHHGTQRLTNCDTVDVTMSHLRRTLSQIPTLRLLHPGFMLDLELSPQRWRVKLQGGP